MRYNPPHTRWTENETTLRRQYSRTMIVRYAEVLLLPFAIGALSTGLLLWAWGVWR